MEREVLFRDYQKATTADFNNLQTYARQSFDDLVGDAVTASVRYAGLITTKTNIAEITVTPGRVYEPNPAGIIGVGVYTLPQQSIISLVQYLCVSTSTQRILLLVGYGVENQVDVQNRDYLTNTQTLQTSPKAVSMTDSRDAVLAIVAGAENASPLMPQIPVGQVAIASIVVNSQGIISVTMLPDGSVTSTENLNERVDVIEAFDAAIALRIAALASDLADLANKIKGLGAFGVIIELMQDMALVKEKVQLPASHSAYGASFFLYDDGVSFDSANTQGLGYNALIEQGLRFPAQNAALAALSMFSPIDPNGSYNSGSGLLLPHYTNALKLKTGNYVTSVPMGQYGFQTLVYEQQKISYTRIRYGECYHKCSRGEDQWHSATNEQPCWWLQNRHDYDDEEEEHPDCDKHHREDDDDFKWVDTWDETYWTLDSVSNSINGALIAQSFLVSSDTWVTRLGIYVSAVGAANPPANPANVSIGLVGCTNGQPDLTLTMGIATIAGNQLYVGMNYVDIPPVFLAKGSRAAVTVYSAGNHSLGLAQAGSYLDGTFFYSLDGAYYLGDFTKEMLLEIWGAQFTTNQVTVEFNAQNLQGGIRDIDLQARMVVPASTQLVFECLPDGGSTWLPLTMDPTNPIAPFANAPVLMRFRGRFVGSPDIMPGIVLPDSRMHIWCPGPTFTFVSAIETLPAPTTNLSLKLTVSNFNVTPHSLSAGTGDGTGYIKLFYGGSYKLPTSITFALTDPAAQTFDVTATFAGIPSTSSFTICIKGTTNSVTQTFFIPQMVWWAA